MSQEEALLLGVVTVVGGFMVSIHLLQRAARKKQVMQGAKDWIETVKRARSLPVVESKLMLKSGEIAFYSETACLQETRAVRHYVSGSAGYKITENVRIGATSGRSESSQEWRTVDNGTLTVTNWRVIFSGSTGTKIIEKENIISCLASLDEIEIASDKRQKPMRLTSTNPVILKGIIHLVCVAPNPQDLRNVKIEIDDA
jgi:hypothetical protein